MPERSAGARLKVPFFLFSRHGETDWNVAGRWQGKTDIPLNDVGRAQAEANGLRLRAYLAGNGLEASSLPILASPLCRARETAEILARHIGRSADTITLDQRLMELTFGIWEGLTLDEVKARHPEGFEERLKTSWHYRGHGGESYNCLKERVLPLLESLDAPCLVVAHGGTLRVLYHLFAGIEENQAHFQPIRQDVLFHISGSGLSAF